MTKPATAASEKPATAASEKPSAAVASRTTKPEAVAATTALPVLELSGKPQQPKSIAAPRSGKPDDLKLVSGIGPKIERTLHGLGYFHFDQIASWTADEVQWVDERLKFKGRIVREDWQSQARRLAGSTTEIEDSATRKKPDDARPPARKRAKKEKT